MLIADFILNDIIHVESANRMGIPTLGYNTIAPTYNTVHDINKAVPALGQCHMGYQILLPPPKKRYGTENAVN